jgi:acetyl-CoA acyltransferase 2
MQQEIVFIGAKRTAFGTFSGAVKHLSATDLAVHASKAAIEQSGLSADQIDECIYGNVLQTSKDAIYLARHVALKSGMAQKTPALTVNRLCGSGFEAVVLGAKQLLLGEAQVVLVGGTESMSQAPHIVRGARDGFGFGRSTELEDSLSACLVDSYTGSPMAITAENLAIQYEISRQECDAFALQSQQRWAKAQAEGAFKQEIAPIELKSKKGVVAFDTDEHPRESTLDTLAKLKPVFKADGVVTAGNASGICDGAASLIMTTRAHAEKLGVTPIAKLISWGISGCDPNIMGIGPVPASQIALSKAGKSVADMDLVEVNEAFAPQFLAVEKALGLDRTKTNVDGGAISLGHPLGASGARITAHLIYALKARGLKLGLGSACIGGGQGISVIIEAL